MPSSNVIQSSVRAPESILVVEGDVLIRMIICAYLEECGFRVIQAANSDEALQVLQELDPPVEVVLSEVELPGAMGGFALAQWVRARKPGVPVFLVGSAAGAANAASELCDSSSTPIKPDPPEILLQRIKRLLAQRKPCQAA